MRAEVAGWTPGASRRLTRMMWALDLNAIDGTAWSVTTTMPAWTMPDRVTPTPLENNANNAARPGQRGSGGERGDRVAPTLTPDRMHAIIDAVTARLRRAGAVAWIWIIETTARRTPHVHWTVWMPSKATAADVRGLVVRAWAELLAAESIRVADGAQYVRRVEDAGWLAYVSKHGARSVKQYQRHEVPIGWEKRTGRMWGYGPRQTVQAAVVAPVEGVPEGLRAFWRLRRLLRSWAIADARAQPLIYRVGGRVQHVSAEAVRTMPVSQRGALGDALREHDRRVRACRRCIRCGDRALSPVRGGAWGVAEVVSLRLWAAAHRA